MSQLPGAPRGARACFPHPPAAEVSLEAPRVQRRRLGLPSELLALRQDTSVRTHWFNRHWALAQQNSGSGPNPDRHATLQGGDTLKPPEKDRWSPTAGTSLWSGGYECALPMQGARS